MKRSKWIRPSKDNLQLGGPMMLCIFMGCQALLDIVEFVGMDWLGWEATQGVLTVLKWVTLISFPGILIIWLIFGEWLKEKITNWGWLIGSLASIPLSVIVRFSLGFLEDLNRSRNWMEEERFFRLCRMIGNCILPLGALIGLCWAAIVRRKKQKRAGSEEKCENGKVGH